MKKISYLQKWIGALRNHVSLDRGRHEKICVGILLLCEKMTWGCESVVVWVTMVSYPTNLARFKSRHGTSGNDTCSSPKIPFAFTRKLHGGPASSYKMRKLEAS